MPGTGPSSSDPQSGDAQSGDARTSNPQTRSDRWLIMRSTRRISRFVAAVAGAVFHVVVLGDVGGPPAREAGVIRRDTD